MKEDWNQRAKENARHYIASSVASDEPTFDASGKQDVGYFFDGIEQLLHPDQDVLDIGCGIGRMDRHMAPRVRELHGIDVSGEMIRMANERMADLPNTHYHEGDGWTLAPFENGKFGLVMSHIVFQHAPRAVASAYFAEAYRVLKPGGEFVFQMPEQIAPNQPPDPPDADTFGMRFYAEQDLREQIEELGFHWIECRRFPAGNEGQEFNQLRIRCQR